MPKKFLILILFILFSVFIFISPCLATLSPSEGLDVVVEEGYGKTVEIGEGQAQAALYETIGAVVNVVLSALGIVMLIIIVYSGYLWMMAGGNEEQVTKAKKWILNASIGILIIGISFYAVDYILYRLAQL